jgi:nicotinate-nucleotide adenylyltransferase
LRLGILGGVFNPPHLGHLIFAQEACGQLELDEVVLMPVGRAPHREVESDPGGEVRLELCRAAIAGDERLACSRLELDRPGASYTVDTLRALRAQRPSDDELVLLLGADQAVELPSWREPEQVLALAETGVAARAELGPSEVRSRLAGLGDGRLRFFDMPRIDISSSLVRRRVAGGLPVRYLVPEGVERLIAGRELYRAEVGAR